MKKLLKTLLVCLLCFAMISACAEEAAKPEPITSGEYQYILLEDGTAEITGYNGSAAQLEIPAKLDGHTVTGIGDSAFSWCSSLTGVTIPDSVTSIGDYAFSGCSSLTGVTIPDSVTSIGANPFLYCSKLSSVRLSAQHPTLAVIDGVLFQKSNKALICYPCGKDGNEYAIPQGIAEIGSYAFYDCENLTGVTIPDSVTSIGERAFYGFKSLISVTIPDSVTSIGEGAFYGCESLTGVTIPDSVTSIGNSAFSECSSLTDVTIPDSVTSIGKEAFSRCSSLTSVTIPDSVTSIGERAFYGCSSALLVIVERGSDAEQYCGENDIAFAYPDYLDWLTK